MPRKVLLHSLCDPGGPHPMFPAMAADHPAYPNWEHDAADALRMAAHHSNLKIVDDDEGCISMTRDQSVRFLSYIMKHQHLTFIAIVFRKH